MLSCPNGELSFDRRKEGNESRGGKDQHPSHGRRRPLGPRTPAPRYEEREADPDANTTSERLLVPHIVLAINCANKTLTDDQTNGSPITDLSAGGRREEEENHEDDDDDGKGDQRTWGNISFTFECEIIHASRSTAPIIMFFLSVFFLSIYLSNPTSNSRSPVTYTRPASDGCLGSDFDHDKSSASKIETPVQSVRFSGAGDPLEASL